MDTNPTLPDTSDADIRRWRSVQTGLRMLMTACIGMPVGLGIILALGCVFDAIVHRDPRIAAAMQWLVGIGLLAGLVYVAVGVGYCCRVPADSGARLPLCWAIGSILFGAGLLIATQFFFFDFLRGSWPRGASVHVGWLLLALYSASVFGFVFGCLAWLLFLRALARALEAEDLVRHLRNYALGFAAWAGIGVASLWALHLRVGGSPLIGGIALLNIILCFVHYFWMNYLLSWVAEVVQGRLGPSGLNNDSEPAKSESDPSSPDKPVGVPG